MFSNLRRLLSDAGFDARGVLAKAPPGYRLNVADVDCDLGRFHTERLPECMHNRLLSPFLALRNSECIDKCVECAAVQE
jgi:DNA-binding SARP family transcriptional activator